MECCNPRVLEFITNEIVRLQGTRPSAQDMLSLGRVSRLADLCDDITAKRARRLLTSISKAWGHAMTSLIDIDSIRDRLADLLEKCAQSNRRLMTELAMERDDAESLITALWLAVGEADETFKCFGWNLAIVDSLAKSLLQRGALWEAPPTHDPPDSMIWVAVISGEGWWSIPILARAQQLGRLRIR